MNLLSVNINEIVIIIFLLMFGPAIVFAVIGMIFSINAKKKAAKIMYILAIVSLIISFGICGGLMYG